MLQKSNPVRSKRLRDAARGQPCIRCGVDDGTVVLAHYTGFRQHEYGKGRGIKCDDHMAADLCMACHQHLDNPAQRKSIEASEEFLHLIARTWRRRIAEGLISIEGAA